VRAIRLAAGMTQTELGEHMTREGVPGRSHVTIAKIESSNGTRAVGLAEAVVYAKLAGITVERLIDPTPITVTTSY